MEPKKNNSDNIILGYSIFCVICLVLAFKSGVALDSLMGAAIIGAILVGYLCWFVYDTFVSQTNFTLSKAISFNLKKNPAVWAMYCFWLVFIFVPVITNTFF